MTTFCHFAPAKKTHCCNLEKQVHEFDDFKKKSHRSLKKISLNVEMLVRERVKK